jgi:hypothetical protein
MTVEEQFLQLENWRHLLAGGEGKSEVAGDQTLALFRAAYEELEPMYKSVGRSYDDVVSRHPNEPPLFMLFWCTFQGIYPPPELMLTLLDCWNAYGDGVTLEEAFLGKPVQKLGDYKNRLRARSQREMRYDRFVKMTSEGVPAIKAAEWIAEWGFGGSTDPDSVLREMRACAKAGREAEK